MLRAMSSNVRPENRPVVIVCVMLRRTGAAIPVAFPSAVMFALSTKNGVRERETLLARRFAIFRNGPASAVR